MRYESNGLKLYHKQKKKNSFGRDVIFEDKNKEKNEQKKTLILLGPHTLSIMIVDTSDSKHQRKQFQKNQKRLLATTEI